MVLQNTANNFATKSSENCLRMETLGMDISPADMWAVTGLMLDAIGIVSLFLFAPEKFPDPQSTAFFAIEDGSRDKWRKKQKKRYKVAKLSVFIIVLGFIFQAIAIVFW